MVEEKDRVAPLVDPFPSTHTLENETPTLRIIEELVDVVELRNIFPFFCSFVVLLYFGFSTFRIPSTSSTFFHINFSFTVTEH